MADKGFLLFLVILLLCLPLLFAQEENTDLEPPQINYFIDRSEGEPRFIQRLIWEAGRNVIRYEVVVERLERRGYVEVERVSVETNQCELSLTAGHYRYRVEVYDFFDDLAYITPYWEFEVMRATQPAISSFNPRIFYLDEDEVWEINVRGQNLTSRSVIYLIQDNRRINPLSVNIDGNSAHLVFSPNALIPGEYDIYVINPGGLDAQLGTFTITYRKLRDFNFSIGSAPIFPLYGYLFNDTLMDGGEILEAPFSGDFYPLSIAAKASFIPLKRAWGSLGIEASGSFSLLQQERDSFYTTNTFFINAHISLLYQKYFKKRKYSFNANVGAGITTLMNFYYEYNVGIPTEMANASFFSVTGGLSFSVFVTRRIFINAGMDFFHIITPANPMPGFIRPFVGAGFHL